MEIRGVAYSAIKVTAKTTPSLMTSSRNVMDAAMRFVDFSRAIVGR